MAGTIDGGKLAANTNKSKYGADYYSRIGKIGGKKSAVKGFALMDKEKLSEVSKRGGTISKRGKAKN